MQCRVRRIDEENPCQQLPLSGSQIETIARCLWPDIQAFYESEEGQKAFADWKAGQEKKQQPDEQEQLPAAA